MENTKLTIAEAVEHLRNGGAIRKDLPKTDVTIQQVMAAALATKFSTPIGSAIYYWIDRNTGNWRDGTYTDRHVVRLSQITDEYQTPTSKDNLQVEAQTVESANVDYVQIAADFLKENNISDHLIDDDKEYSSWDLSCLLAMFHETLIQQSQPNTSALEAENVIDAIKNIPQRPQVQYDLQRQIAELRMAANKLGLYDAADFLNPTK